MDRENTIRKIIHIDMDAFYASVEQRDNEKLIGQPIAVGGSRERGVVAAASYEARKYGVHSAMPSSRAAKLCPDLIFVKPRFEKYKEVSKQIREVFFQYTDLVEPLSLDEAYLDVTKAKMGKPSATLIAQEIKAKIKEKTQLNASAGISYNKFLAKIASDMDKPNGLYVILPDEANEFIRKLPIKKFHGIGRVTAEKMKKAGIFTGGDLRKKSLQDLTQRFGKTGYHYYQISRGIDERPVNPDRERKSVSAENTFDKDLYTIEEIKSRLIPISEEVWKRYQKLDVTGKTTTLKIKYATFEQITRSQTIETGIAEYRQFEKIILDILKEKELLREEGIRLLGVGISNFIQAREELDYQLTLSF